MNWEKLEKEVKLISRYLWNKEAKGETINGVKHDCVIKKENDFWIIIEATIRKDLDKLRGDINRLVSTKSYLLARNIYTKCYFVCYEKPNDSLIKTGQGHNIEVMSLVEFQNQFFDYDIYWNERSKKNFGSAVNPLTGERDTVNYVPVKYYDISNNKEYELSDICSALHRGNKIVLTGNYGTGKSRCIQEVFFKMNDNDKNGKHFIFSINLRDNWGTERGYEIIRRHFDGLGMGDKTDSLIKIIKEKSVCLLLDGFDEIAAQVWSDDPNKLKHIRSESLAAVKDLVDGSNGGILITGREHYFNSDEEMFFCLGLDKDAVIFLEAPDEFTNEEMKQYLDNISKSLSLPSWLPRRPLVCQVISELEKKQIEELLSADSEELDFWFTFIDAICKREAKIRRTLDHDVIHNVLVRIARKTRTKRRDLGPISTEEINRAFEEITKLPAVDESAVILQRLPTLGRIGPESTDRQFMDEFILNGLRAEDVVNAIKMQDESLKYERWINPLSKFGLNLVSQSIERENLSSHCIKYISLLTRYSNHVLAADIVASLLLNREHYDFRNVLIHDAYISLLDFSSSKSLNMVIEKSYISELDITNAEIGNIIFKNCVIGNVFGITAGRGTPDYFHSCKIEYYEAVNTVSRIRDAKITDKQRVFLTIIKKVYFQPGSGRKEAALLRGMGSSADRKASRQILNKLQSEGIIECFKGDEGLVYKPVRKHTKRMEDIFFKLTLSDDPIWQWLKE